MKNFGNNNDVVGSNLNQQSPGYESFGLIALLVFYVVSKRTRGATGEDLPADMEQVFAVPLIMRPVRASNPQKGKSREQQLNSGT